MTAAEPRERATRAFPPITVAARCDRCGVSFNARATTIVDADDPANRDALLAGTLNVVGCPACGQAVALQTPLLYVDTGAEIALVYQPSALTQSREEQERVIGSLTNRVLDQLPASERKMYLLQPRTFFVPESFMEAVLAANGVSAEEVERARETAALLEELASLGNAEEVEQRLEALGRKDDPTLAGFAAALADEAARRGDLPRAERMARLTERLGTVVGRETVSVEELIELLQEARGNGEVESAVAALRPVLDYAFFAELTRRIDADAGPGAAELVGLRTSLLAAIDAHDARVAAELERGRDTLQAVLAAPDWSDAVRRRAPALDSAFFSVVQASVAAAREAGDAAGEQRLRDVRDTALRSIESAMPPRQRLVNRLARLSGADEVDALLDEAANLLDAETLAAVRRAAAEAEALGAAEASERLRAAADRIDRRIATVESPAP